MKIGKNEKITIPLTKTKKCQKLKLNMNSFGTELENVSDKGSLTLKPHF